MRSRETYFNKASKRWRPLLAPLAVIVAIGCLFTPVVAGEFPTETTKLQRTNLLEDYTLIATWRRIDVSRSATVGVRANRILIDIMISETYAATSEAVISNTRAYATLTSPDNVIIFAGLLANVARQPGNIDGAWGLSRSQSFNVHILIEGTYTVTIDYEILIGGSWTHVDNATHYLNCLYPEPPPDVPTEAEPTAWLPFMLSFAVIAGMAFIGFNLARGRDPTAGLFMLFAGIVLVWSIGWLPTWIFITAIALVSLLSAALWGKLFKGR